MKYVVLTLILLYCCLYPNGTQPSVIELPLTYETGYGCFFQNLGGIPPYSNDNGDPWIKTRLKVKGAPTHWKEVQYGEINTNIYQSAYQDYLQGTITQEWFASVRKSWKWQPDTAMLSAKPLKTKIAFAVGRDATGERRMVLDANNNLDFSDDTTFAPPLFPVGKKMNMDSLAACHARRVSYEKYVHRRIISDTVSVFIVYMPYADMYLCNFMQHAVAHFQGSRIAVCPDRDGFASLSYCNANIAVTDSLAQGRKMEHQRLIAKNEYLELNGKIYKNLGVNTLHGTLMLEEITRPKEELHATQIGYHAFPFEGKDVKTATPLGSESLKGKYVLLDFWAVGCVPCLQEMPHLKKLYKNTPREMLEIVGIVGESSAEQLMRIIEKEKISWPQIVEDADRIIETYGVNVFPTTYLLDPEGVVIAKNLRGTALKDKISELLNKPKATE